MKFEQDTANFAELREKYRKALIWAAAIACACLCVAMCMPLIGFGRNYQFLSGFFFLHQDLWFALPVILVPALLLTTHEAAGPARRLEFFASPRALCLVAMGLVTACWLGHHFVYLGYNLSRDEQMADFDAYIFAHGKFFWPLPRFWQAHAQALNQLFMVAIGDHEAWASAYLPVNAAMRAVMSLLGAASLTSPVMTALGAASLWRVAGRLWPDCPSARGVALILYAGSAQVIVNGMTAYAMSGHLALNLVWLDLFLLNRRRSHLGALVIGFLATGLHQPLFHPLFVLPFLELIASQKRWRTLALYLVGYLFIGAFWFAWPKWISAHGIGHIAPLDPATPDYFRRFVLNVHPINLEAVWLTTLNILRFFTWQHLLLLPLLAIGIRATWNRDPFARAVAKSLLLPLAVLLIILPYQGHGWGYRYMHGVIGNGCLLACYGWVALQSQGLSLRRALAWTTAATFLVVMPIRFSMVHHMVRNFAGVSRAIGKSTARFVIVDDMAAQYVLDGVVNLPDLSNRPIELVASGLR